MPWHIGKQEKIDRLEKEVHALKVKQPQAEEAFNIALKSLEDALVERKKRNGH